jgi:hypothetical protein
VIALQADGGGMYTNQALWTMAREKLDVTTIILNNGSYAILNIELMRVGVQNPGPKALVDARPEESRRSTGRSCPKAWACLRCGSKRRGFPRRAGRRAGP